MLLNQAPITKETSKLIRMIEGYGLKIRLLNVRFDEMSLSLAEDKESLEGKQGGAGPPIPSREGLDDNYYYSYPADD